MHECTHLPGKALGDIRYARQYDRIFFIQLREINPVVQAAPAQGIVNLTCTVRRNYYDWRFQRLDGANLWNGYLKVREQFEQVGLKLLVAAVQFIDEQYRS